MVLFASKHSTEMDECVGTETADSAHGKAALSGVTDVYHQFFFFFSPRVSRESQGHTSRMFRMLPNWLTDLAPAHP